ncbi:MAG: hypothetical protein SWY16_20595 [Cyanobacteriota bacterium]|nr:hypothetical protein [Cyanobacteriota bacterium]
MYCPMQLDCKIMTGQIHNCPNVSECLRNSPLQRRSAMQLYFQNLGVQPEEVETRTPSYSRLCVLAPLTAPGPLSFPYNRDYSTRDRIIFGSPVNWDEQLGGIKHFCDLSIAQLAELIDGEFVNPNSRHNLSPPIATLLEFARNGETRGFEFTFEGYAVHPSREDYRTSIDGIGCEGTCPPSLIAEFRELTRHADELTLQSHHLRAWWD